MSMIQSFIKISGTCVLILLASAVVYACTTKVSEWTILNLEPASYMLVYFNNGEIDAAAKQEHATLETSLKDANIFLYNVNTGKFKNEQEKTFYAMTGRQNPPFYALYYQDRLFAVYDKGAVPAHLSTSKMRKTIAEYLKDGELCVLVHLETGHAAKDAPGKQAVQRYLSKSILKDIVPVVSLSRTDPQERAFADLLLQTEYDLAGIQEPMLFGIFGRFRVLEPLVGQAITEENVEYLLQFFTMDCSCLVKYQMPGIDMLCSDDWTGIQPAKLNLIITQ
jgi:hypothetical protein